MATNDQMDVDRILAFVHHFLCEREAMPAPASSDEALDRFIAFLAARLIGRLHHNICTDGLTGGMWGVTRSFEEVAQPLTLDDLLTGKGCEISSLARQYQDVCTAKSKTWRI